VKKIDENKSRSVTNKQEHINIIGTTSYTRGSRHWRMV